MPRANTPQEIFDAMPAHFKSEAAGDLNTVVQFDLSGEGGGQWHAVIANGQLTVNTGPAEAPAVVFGASAADYVALINGELSPMTAFMQGKIKLRGDMALAMRMQNLFRRD